MSLRRSIIFLLRWHRRIAVAVAIFLILLSLTGILLNHTSELGLDRIQLNSSLVADWYGVERPKPVGYAADKAWIIHDGLQSLYLNQTKITDCDPPLYGAVSFQQTLFALCRDELLLITDDGLLLERIGQVYGLPEGSNALAIAAGGLITRANQTIYSVDIDSLQWTVSQLTKGEVDWPRPESLPENLNRQLNNSNPGISLERLLLDLHSGRLFGNAGVLFMDLVAIFLILLVISGLTAWIKYAKLQDITNNHSDDAKKTIGQTDRKS